ncbi:unnamed protein product, partial [Hymenolepis diminuta]
MDLYRRLWDRLRFDRRLRMQLFSSGSLKVTISPYSLEFIICQINNRFIYT